MAPRPVRSQSRAVTVVYGGIATALLAVVAVVAIVVVPPSPPSVAEFAPQAETIDEAPASQSSRFGAGDGACGAGQAGCIGPDGQPITTTTTAPPPDTDGTNQVVDKARVRRCIGDPPRQTEDPQSPPCVNYFEGDNGGATWRGVTRDEIRVVLPCLFDCGDGADLAARAAPLVDHFNRRYEFYGRKLRAIVVSRNGSATTPGGSSNDPNAQRFVAEKADEEAKAFAIVGPALASTTRPLFTEASRRGLIGVSGGADDLTSDDFERAAPLLWAYQPPIDVLERETAAFVCASLAEHLALHAGPAEAVRTRKFAVAVPKRTSGNPPTAALVDGLERCGVKPRVDQFATSFLSGQPPPEVAALVADWRADGITSVISLASQSEELGIMSAASRSGYQPEWVHIGLEQQEGVSAYQSLTPQDQSAHVFGVASRNKLVAHSDRPFFWAIRESQPEFTATINDIQVTEPLYRRLLLLAAGIQMAGPNLNPTTFERGLFKARFANPGAGRSPYFQASVRLAGAHRYMVDDLALTWWEPSADAFNEGSAPRGSWCYVDRGARWRGNWPDRDAAFFDRAQPCR